MASKILLSVMLSFLSFGQVFGFWCDPCECCWTGFYIGGNLGGSHHTFSLYDIDFDWFGGTQELKNQNFFGGAQIGYNHQ